MALPPTQLTSLLYAGPDTASRVRALVDGGSLSATADRDAVGRVIDEAFAHVASMPPGWCGPSGADVAAARLAEAGLLSAKGERQRRASPESVLPDATAEPLAAPWWARSRLLLAAAASIFAGTLILACFATLPLFGIRADVSFFTPEPRSTFQHVGLTIACVAVAGACGYFLVARRRRLRRLATSAVRETS